MILAGAWFGTGFLPVLPRRLINQRVIALWSLMSKFLSAVTLFLMSSSLFAAMKEMDAANAPAETVDVVWVIVFGVIFIGSIVGFFIYLWHTDKNGKSGK